MSQVTNVIICTSSSEPDGIVQSLNAPVCSIRTLPEVRFDEIPSRCIAGDKCLECNIYLGAFNYLDLEAFMEAVRSVKWESPLEVQVFVKKEHDLLFREVMW